MIRNGLKHEPLGGIPDLPASAALESQGLRIWVDAKPRSPPISFWNLYRPPTRGGGDNRDGALHCNRWPSGPNTFLLGDLNAHGSWENDTEQDDMGEEVDNFVDSKGMRILNTGDPTRFSASGFPSAPDVSIAGSNFALVTDWLTLEPFGTDHLPILISIPNLLDQPRPIGSYSVKKCDWGVFSRRVSEKLPDLNLD